MSLDAQGGAANIRFQPYRIYNSRGHLTDDRRMSCVACHDPHDQLRRDAAYYDAKCLACHLSTAKETKTQARSAPACPVSTTQCATCHMPKVELPEMHFKFTDHWIRVVKPGAATPR
jgi:cytochrome c peroxidase